MKCYLEAGAQESDYFDVEVPESVWNKQVHVYSFEVSKIKICSMFALLQCIATGVPTHIFLA